MNGGVVLDTTIYELNDGRKLGIKAFEIVSLPTITSSGKNQEESCQYLYGIPLDDRKSSSSDFFIKDTYI